MSMQQEDFLAVLGVLTVYTLGGTVVPPNVKTCTPVRKATLPLHMKSYARVASSSNRCRAVIQGPEMTSTL